MASIPQESIAGVPRQRNTAIVQVAVAGVGGYAGGELARLLLCHPRLGLRCPLFFGRASDDGTYDQSTLEELHPHLPSAAETVVSPFRWEALEEGGVDVLLLATPHEQSRTWVPQALERGIRIIDLSGAWRLRQAKNRAAYRFDNDCSGIATRTQASAVYGSPELHKNAIRQASLVANPGCYATSIILALAPLVRSGIVDLTHEIVCDAKSGVSGAGKTPTAATHFMAAADNLSAYAVFGHRHTGELLEQLVLSERQIRFTPHLLPIPRGILSTIYLRFNQPSDTETIVELMRTFYRDSPFVRLRKPGMLPQIQHVVGTNFCDVGVAIDEDGDRITVVSCLDNLLKGAAGQAVQNLNLMCGWGETEGLL